MQPYAQYANSMMTAPQVTVSYNPAGTPPSVTVIATMSVTPLIPLTCLGNSMSGVNFLQQDTYPLIKSMAGVQNSN